jgi:CheY-like chemotaxis protein
MRILLVEDHDEFRTAIELLLLGAGHEVRAASTAADALRHLREAPAELLLTDIILPGEDGVQLIMKVRQEFPDIGIIAMSGSGSHSPLYLKIAKQLGAGVTLLKPFSMDELSVAIARMELNRASDPSSQ